METAELYTFVAAFRYGVVASLGPDTWPQCALVGIAVTPSLEVIFDTVKASRKYANLAARPACSLVIGWGGEQTVQMEGTAFAPVGTELAAYREAYFRTWPDGRDRLAWPGLVHFVVRPRWIRFSDFDPRPPRTHEFRFDTSGSLPDQPPMVY